MTTTVPATGHLRPSARQAVAVVLSFAFAYFLSALLRAVTAIGESLARR